MTKSRIIWKSNLKKVNNAKKCNQFFSRRLHTHTQMCSDASFEHFTLWVELFLNTWQCSVESHNYFTEKNLTGESPGPRIVWWCRKHAENPPSIFQHGDQLKELIKLGFHWGFYFKKGAILLFELTWILWSLNLKNLLA